jgi:hypothetical protein
MIRPPMYVAIHLLSGLTKIKKNFVPQVRQWFGLHVHVEQGDLIWFSGKNNKCLNVLSTPIILYEYFIVVNGCSLDS